MKSLATVVVPVVALLAGGLLTSTAPAAAAPITTGEAPAATARADLRTEAERLTARFPRPGMVTERDRQISMSVAPSSKGGATTNATIVCVGFSELIRATIPGTSFFQAVGKSTTECPINIDYISAQTELFVFVPDLNRWERVGVGSLDFRFRSQTQPSWQAISTTSSSCLARIYMVKGTHVVRLGAQQLMGESFLEDSVPLCLDPQ